MNSSVSKFPSPASSQTNWPWVQDHNPIPERMPDGTLWPRISIITPSYNQGDYLEEAIRSVLLQGYPNLEYIIMDGGSSDRSLEILERYDPWITHWESKPDKGQSHAINKGFDVATGQIIAWMNSDDIYYPAALMKAAEIFISQPGISGVIGQCGQMTEDGSLINVRPAVDFNAERILKGGKIPGQPAVFLSTDIVKNLGGLREDLYYILDWEYWLRIGYNYPNRAQTIGEILAVERIWGGRKTLEEAGKESAQERRKVFDDYFDSPDLPSYWMEIKPIAYSETYWRQGRSHLFENERSSARLSFWNAFQLSPSFSSLVKLSVYLLGSLIGYNTSRKIAQYSPAFLRDLWHRRD